MSSGGTPTTTVAEYWDGGINWVSPKDFSGGAEICSSGLNISEDGRVAGRLELLPIGTVVLVVRSGVLAHTLPAAVLAKPATINQDIKALKLRAEIEPKYLAHYLSVHQDYLLPLIRKHGATVHSINTPELLKLEIPLPPIDVQYRLVAELGAAGIERDCALAEAERLLTTFEPWAVKEMGLLAPNEDGRKVYAIRRNAAGTRIDPFYHSPEFVEIERTIQAIPHAPLGSLVEFSNDTWNVKEHPEPAFRYIEISGVDRRRGQASASDVSVVDAPSRARMVVQPDDIIVSLTRPHHGSIALLNKSHRGCIASTGFAVIRSVDERRIARTFLWAALRLSLSLKQMLRRASGGNYPAITQDELSNVLIPLPDKRTQQRIVAEVVSRNKQADRLEVHAEIIWREARERFEHQLLRGGKA